MTDNPSPKSRFRQYLQLVATGPELSKSLDADQAEDAMSMILEQQIDAISAAIFLIALRMKRESDAENSGVLSALIKKMDTATSAHDDIIALADPFNGYLRGIPATPFLPAVLAACGLPAYLHGMQLAGPKYGVTAHMVLRAAGKSVDLTAADAARQLDLETCGWAYIDQQQYIPALHHLVGLRDNMVKRTCLSTLEVVLKPISGRRSTHLLTGFVHKAYPPVYAQLAKQAGFASAALVRGVEGGCIASLSQLSRYFAYHGESELQLHRLAPKELGIEQQDRMVTIASSYEGCLQATGFESTDSLAPLVEHCVELGVAALQNAPGAMRDSLIFGAAVCLTQAGKSDNLQHGAEIARQAISDGAAWARFNRA